MIHTVYHGKSSLRVSLSESFEQISLPFFVEWIEALRSGKYLQAIEALNSFGSHECLYYLYKTK